MAKSPTKTSGFIRGIQAVLATIDRPGSFATFGDCPLILPGLEVDGIGSIAFPFGKLQSKALADRCVQAPYGKGTKTVVDTKVRKVWELDPDHFSITNPHWKGYVDTILKKAEAALGLDETKLEAYLYKLLMYEKGGFFLPHRDGEKLDGMVATLVIGLPSHYTGGELVVVHEGKRVEIGFQGAASGFGLSYAVFYADCRHEVLPLKSDFRLCLVYNVKLSGKATDKRELKAPQSAAAITSLSSLLSQWPDDANIKKIVVPLEHQYSKDGLSLHTLKGVDRAKADVLLAAAEEGGCVGYLALVTYWVSGSAMYAEDSYSRRRDRYRYRSDDDDDDDSENDSEYVMEEVFNESTSIDNWIDRDGIKHKIRSIDLDEAELVGDESIEDWQVSEEDFEGYTGNAGMTLERWYRRAAVVIWPTARSFDIHAQAGTDGAIAWFTAKVNEWRKAAKTKKPALLLEAKAAAKIIIESWEVTHSSRGENTGRTEFPSLLEQLGEPPLLVDFILKVMPKQTEISLGQTFLDFCETYGWAVFEPALLELFRGAAPLSLARNLTLLEAISRHSGASSDRIHICRNLLEAAIDALTGLDADLKRPETRQLERRVILISLSRILITLDDGDSFDRLMDHVLAHAKLYDLTNIHLVAVFELESAFAQVGPNTKAGVKRWFTYCGDELAVRIKAVPRFPKDFRRGAEVSCTCAECRQLRRFLDDPSESVHHFRVSEERRKHVERMISNDRLDFVATTLRTGRPYSLVCTKTTASYDKLYKTHLEDESNLSRLRELEKKLKL